MIQMKIVCQEELVPGTALNEKIENLEKYGFDGIELWGGNLKERAKEINRVCNKSKVKPSTVCAGYRGCPLDSDNKERDLAYKDIKELLSIAKDIGATGLIFVPVFGKPKLPDLFPLKSAIDLEKELLVEQLKQIKDVAEKNKVYLLVEPLNRYETHLLNRLEQAVEICKKVNSKYIKIMADFFHMSIEEINMPESIEKAGEFIKHIHLADSTRLLPGYGHIDFKKGFDSLKRIGYKGYMALECSRIHGIAEVELPKAVKYIKECIGK